MIHTPIVLLVDSFGIFLLSFICVCSFLCRMLLQRDSARARDLLKYSINRELVVVVTAAAAAAVVAASISYSFYSCYFLFVCLAS